MPFRRTGHERHVTGRYWPDKFLLRPRRCEQPYEERMEHSVTGVLASTACTSTPNLFLMSLALAWTRASPSWPASVTYFEISSRIARMRTYSAVRRKSVALLTSITVGGLDCGSSVGVTG